MVVMEWKEHFWLEHKRRLPGGDRDHSRPWRTLSCRNLSMKRFIKVLAVKEILKRLHQCEYGRNGIPESKFTGKKMEPELTYRVLRREGKPDLEPPKESQSSEQYCHVLLNLGWGNQPFIIMWAASAL